MILEPLTYFYFLLVHAQMDVTVFDCYPALVALLAMR